MQENIDWKTQENRDSLKKFIESQVAEHGSFEAAAKNYCAKSGVAEPNLVVGDPVLDYTLRRVGVPVEGPAEPEFLWVGSPYTTEKPVTTPDGKRPFPQPPTFY